MCVQSTLFRVKFSPYTSGPVFYQLDLEYAICMPDSNLGVYLEPCQISKVKFFRENS